MFKLNFLKKKKKIGKKGIKMKGNGKMAKRKDVELKKKDLIHDNIILA